MHERFNAPLIGALAAIAPGRPLRTGLDRILQANKGALVVVGDGPSVLELCSGGFLIDAEFTPLRLSELSKLDGAIILAADASRIARANVHLMPNPSLPTSETGTRHRTAERVARAVDVPVVAVSEDMGVITLYCGEVKHPLSSISQLLGRANQALQTLERYRDRLSSVTSELSALEVEDLVTVRDVVSVLQRAEMVRRIAEEVQGYIVELGADGRLVHLQLEELMAGVEDDRHQIVRDYLPDGDAQGVSTFLGALSAAPDETLLDVKAVASLLRLLPRGLDADTGLQPRGYRLLARLPRLPESVAEKIVARYGTLQKLLAATVTDLDNVEGVSKATARTVKDGLARLAESSILDRYS